MRRAAKVDANQPAIVTALRKAGATVQQLKGVGDSCPDLLIGYRTRNFLLEIKQPGEQLRPGQRKWIDVWRGQACVAYSAEEALRIIGAVR